MSESPPPATMSSRAFWICFAVSVATFLVVGGRFFRDPFHLDAPIFWSYGIIPLLAIGGLIYEKKLNAVGLMLDVIELTCAKFAVTYLLATAVWIVSDKPEVKSVLPPPAPARKPVKPSVIAASEKSDVSGTVIGADGRPVANAMVYVEAGLGAFAFAPPTETATIVHDGGGFSPALSIIRVGQPVRARSLDGRLHTLSGDYPFLPVPRPRTIRFRRPRPPFQPTCTVHPDAKLRRSFVAVFDHPFFTRTDARGRFVLRDVPHGDLGMRVWRPSGPGALRTIEHRARQSIELVYAATTKS